MNTPLQPVGMDHSHTSTIHLTTISSSILFVRYDATKTSTPCKRRNVYAASGTHDFNTFEKFHYTQFFQDIDTPSDDLYQVH